MQVLPNGVVDDQAGDQADKMIELLRKLLRGSVVTPHGPVKHQGVPQAAAA